MKSGQDSLVAPVVRRMQRFYSSDYMYPMLCHPDTLDWGKLLSERKIILVSLGVDKAKVPPSEQQLLGALIVSQIEIAARRRGEDHDLGFRLYIDEAQKFITTSLPEMFEEIRKYGVWITIANQYLGQLMGKTLAAVMGNVTTTVSFEVGKADARELEAYMQPTFTAEDLMNLGKHKAVVKTTLKDTAQPPFAISTPAPPPEYPNAKERAKQIKERSIKKWTPKKRSEVLAWLEERYPIEEFGIPKGDDEDINFEVED